LGDIFPVTDEGRAVVFVWSFVGTGLWGIILGGLVIKMANWVYLSMMMTGYNDWLKNKDAKETKPKTTKRESNRGENGEVEASGTEMVDLSESAKEERKREAEEERLTQLEVRVLPWYTLIGLLIFGLVQWVVVQLIFTAAMQSLESQLGNYGDYTPTNFGNLFYFFFTTSQTICKYPSSRPLKKGNIDLLSFLEGFGEYNPKTTDGRVFWLLWHPITLGAGTFLFVTVTLAFLKVVDARAFWLLGKAITKLKRSALEDSNAYAGEEV